MKALVLAAGKGTRLRPLTHTLPKHLLPVGNKPILLHVLDYIVEAGIEDIGIVVSPDTEPHIREAIGEQRRGRASIEFIRQSEPGGLAHAVQIAEGFLDDSEFLMFLGDNLVQNGVKEFVEAFYVSACDASILLKEVDDPRPFGVADVDASGKVTRMLEKPKEPKSNLVVIGVYIFTSEIHKAIARTKPSWRGELEITDAMQSLLEMGKEIRSCVLPGWWLDIGSNQGLIEANRVVLDAYSERDIKGKALNSRIEGRVQVEEGARIVNSLVRGPAFIATDCQIVNSTIAPFTNIRAGTVVENSSVERSVILEACRIARVRSLTDSVIGRSSTLLGFGNDTGPEKVSVCLGDDSKIEMEC